MLRSLVNVLMYGPIKNIHGSNHLRSSTSVDMVINYTHTTSFEFTLILEYIYGFPYNKTTRKSYCPLEKRFKYI